MRFIQYTSASCMSLSSIASHHLHGRFALVLCLPSPLFTPAESSTCGGSSALQFVFIDSLHCSRNGVLRLDAGPEYGLVCPVSAPDLHLQPARAAAGPRINRAALRRSAISMEPPDSSSQQKNWSEKMMKWFSRARLIGGKNMDL